MNNTYHFLLCALTISYFLGNGAIELIAALTAIMSLLLLKQQGKTYLLSSLPSLTLYFFVGTMVLKNLIITGSLSSFRPLPILGYYFSGLGIYCMLSETTNLKRYLQYCLLIIALVSLDLVIQYITGHNLLGKANPYLAENRLMNFIGDLRVGYALAAISLPICYHLWAERTIFGALFALTMLFIVLITGERSATLILLLGLMAMPILIRKAYLSNIFIIIAVGSCITLISIKPDLTERFIHNTKSVINIDSEYGQLYQTSYNLIRENLWLGVGTKNYHQACTELPANHGLKCNLHPHNIWLEILVEQGIVISATMLLMMLTFAWQFPRNSTNPLRAFAIGCWSYLLLKLFPLTPSSSIFRAWVMLPFFSYCGILTAFNYGARR